MAGLVRERKRGRELGAAEWGNERFMYGHFGLWNAGGAAVIRRLNIF